MPPRPSVKAQERVRENRDRRTTSIVFGGKSVRFDHEIRRLAQGEVMRLLDAPPFGTLDA